MNEKVVQFLNLVKENPELPVIPFVDAEVVADDDYSYWMGSFGNTYIDEYYAGKYRYYFKSDIDELVDDFYDEYGDSKEYENLSDEDFEKAMREKAETVDWHKAILVYINLPEI